LGPEVTICNRTKISPPMEAAAVDFRMLVHVRALTFDLGSIEPFFCELALYDIGMLNDCSLSPLL
jgi:hypothetical protein